ncbi:ArsR/SmtB family transcription factor [Streptomyces sp. NPDC090022]|uniref:ArsR/SmtB family transcription factor n=1 Tax=Streptomyces sp. NPDC090022 TaxID=3365920 RepID=UPI0037FC8819
MPDRELNIRTLDARSLRGLAHPLRIRLLSALRHHGPATASRLAERLGESSGATSYHLRQLAAHGFVVDAPERGKGRERWWRAAHDGTLFDENLIHDPDPAVRGAADVFLQQVASIHAQELNRWLGGAQHWPLAWRRGSDLSDFTLRLGPEQALDLIHQLHAVIDSFRDRVPDGVPDGDAPGAEGVESVRVQVHVFPRADR